MRERTTWNRTEITKRATVDKKADPYQMNQDHSQPAADAYITGDPSSFAEDVHPNNWDVEYDGDGNTKRNEIGMPENRPETFNHAEKTASEEVFLVKKADLCVKVARMMLASRKFASEDALTAAVEDQAVSLMSLGDTDLIQTHNRLAQEQDDDDDDGDEQQKQAQGQQQQSDDDDDDDDQQKQAQQQSDDDDDDDGDEQQKQAQGQQQQSDDDDDDDQQKQAMGALAAKVASSITAGNKKAAQKALRTLVANVSAWTAQQQAPQQDMTQQSQQQMVQDMIQEAMQQQAPQQDMTQQGQQQQDMVQQSQQQQDMDLQSDEALLDQMLAPEEASYANEQDIQMDVPVMDTDVVLSSDEDEVLRTLFAQDGDEQQDDDEQKKQASSPGFVRTAASATVGTKPKGGVSRIGGPGASGGGVEDKLSSLWKTEPDVRAAFGLE